MATSFIHGEVNWAGPSGTPDADVQRMVSAVESYPWAATSVATLDDASVAACVLGVQQAASTDSAPTRPCAESGVVADLSLHNRGELGARLGLDQREARSLRDDELALRAYRRWGVGFADQLLADGVLAIWDAATECLLCWRDAAGSRPLYYYHDRGRRFIFSSDLQSLAAHAHVPGRLDLAYTRSLLEHEFFQHPSRTLIEGVRKLPAGHALTVDREGMVVERYWDPTRLPERRYTDDRDYLEELRGLLREAITCRLPHGGEGVGAHLSGGLDSSSLAVIAARQLREQGREMTAFSWAPPRDVVPDNAGGDERDLAEAAARFGGVPLHYTRLRPEDVVDRVCRDFALRPPSALDIELSTSRQAAAAGVRTMLSGWGGDEFAVFNGRGYLADLARRGHLLAAHRELQLRRKVHGGSLRGAWKGRVLLPLLPDRAFEAVNKGHGLPTGTWPKELRPEFSRRLADVDPLPDSQLRERPGAHRMQLALYSLGHLQYRTESWASHGATLGITYAFPLLDRRIMEFALTVPDRLYFKAGWKRWLYRSAMDGILPNEVRWNPDKFDIAMKRQNAEVRQVAFDAYRQRLQTRRENPLFDIDKRISNWEDFRRQRESDDGRPVPAPRVPYAGGEWLAFTELSPS